MERVVLRMACPHPFMVSHPRDMLPHLLAITPRFLAATAIPLLRPHQPPIEGLPLPLAYPPGQKVWKLRSPTPPVNMMSHPPPTMLPLPKIVSHHILMPPPGSVMVPPPPVVPMPGTLMSPIPPHSPAHYHGEERRSSSHTEVETYLSNLSIHEQASNNIMSNIQTEAEKRDCEHPSQSSTQQPSYYTQITKDIFNLFSLSFLCKSKDLSERRVKLDFGLVAEVARVRGQLGRLDAMITVSFCTREEAGACLNNQSLLAKYPTLSPAPPVNVVTDRDGYYSIEFVNTGMSGIREITNEFSRHGEIVKVQQGGAKNAVKRVTVSYADLEAAMAAVTAYVNNKDVKGIDFVLECLAVTS